MASIGRNRQEKEKKDARWLAYILYAVILVLVVGLMTSAATRVQRPPKKASGSRTPRDLGPAEIDCVRIISSPNSTLVDGALDEVFRAGLGTRRVTVQSLPRDTESHKRGCYSSHVEAHRWAVANGCENTLVLEDDVVFLPDVAERWGPVRRLLASGAPYDTVFLGYLGIRLDPAPERPGLVHLQKPMLAHAVLFSRAASIRVTEMAPWSAHNLSILDAYDVALWHNSVTTPGATYGVDPPFAAQIPSRATFYSVDKGGALIDGVKSFAGMRAFNYFARGACSRVYQLSPFLSRILGMFVELTSDAISIAPVYTCDDVVQL